MTGVWERRDQAQTPDRFSWNVNQPSPPLAARAACSLWTAPPPSVSVAPSDSQAPSRLSGPAPASPLQDFPTSHVGPREAPGASGSPEGIPCHPSHPHRAGLCPQHLPKARLTPDPSPSRGVGLAVICLLRWPRTLRGQARFPPHQPPRA